MSLRAQRPDRPTQPGETSESASKSHSTALSYQGRLAPTDISSQKRTVRPMTENRGSRRRRSDLDLLNDIDDLLAAADSAQVQRTLEQGTNLAAEGHIARFGDDELASYNAAQHAYKLIDNFGETREEDPWGLRHPRTCGCTLCLDDHEIPRDEGLPWLAAGPSSD
jgi:hypothetical protein